MSNPAKTPEEKAAFAAKMAAGRAAKAARIAAGVSTVVVEKPKKKKTPGGPVPKLTELGLKDVPKKPSGGNDDGGWLL